MSVTLVQTIYRPNNSTIFNQQTQVDPYDGFKFNLGNHALNIGKIKLSYTKDGVTEKHTTPIQHMFFNPSSYLWKFLKYEKPLRNNTSTQCVYFYFYLPKSEVTALTMNINDVIVLLNSLISSASISVDGFTYNTLTPSGNLFGNVTEYDTTDNYYIRLKIADVPVLLNQCYTINIYFSNGVWSKDIYINSALFGTGSYNEGAYDSNSY